MAFHKVFRPAEPETGGFYRYLRIDFLSHYGSEYYCPVSILRVYGLTQLDAFRRDQERDARLAEVEDEVFLDELQEKPVPDDMLFYGSALPPIVGHVVELPRSDEAEPSLSDTPEQVSLTTMGVTTEDTTSPSTRTSKPVSDVPTKNGSAPAADDRAVGASSVSSGNGTQETSATSALPSSEVSDPIASTPSSIDLDRKQSVTTTSVTVSEQPEKSATGLPAGEAAVVSKGSQPVTVEPSHRSSAAASKMDSSSESSHASTPVPSSNQHPNSAGSASEKSPTATANVSVTVITPTISQSLSRSTPHVTVPHRPALSTASHHAVKRNDTRHNAQQQPPPQVVYTQMHSSQPQPNESIYGTIMKRLMALEVNTTLSTAYVDEHSRMVWETFRRIEERLHGMERSVSRGPDSLIRP